MLTAYRGESQELCLRECGPPKGRIGPREWVVGLMEQLLESSVACLFQLRGKEFDEIVEKSSAHTHTESVLYMSEYSYAHVPIASVLVFFYLSVVRYVTL